MFNKLQSHRYIYDPFFQIYFACDPMKFVHIANENNLIIIIIIIIIITFSYININLKVHIGCINIHMVYIPPRCTALKGFPNTYAVREAWDDKSSPNVAHC